MQKGVTKHTRNILVLAMPSAVPARACDRTAAQIIEGRHGDMSWHLRGSQIGKLVVRRPRDDRSQLTPVFLWYWMPAAVEGPIGSAATDAGLKELSLGICRLKTLYSQMVYFAVMVVGRVQPNQHVPLCTVVANSRNVTAVSDFGASKRL